MRRHRLTLGLTAGLLFGLGACQWPDWPQHQTLKVRHLEQGFVKGKPVEAEPSEDEGTLTLGSDYLRFCPPDRREPCWTVAGRFPERNTFIGSWTPSDPKTAGQVRSRFDCKVTATRITCEEQVPNEDGDIARVRHTFTRQI